MKNKSRGLGLIIGLVAGIILGKVFDNVAFFVGAGLILGLVLPGFFGPDEKRK